MVIHFFDRGGKMNQPALDLFAMFVLSLVGTIVFAMRAYVAWFSPEEHAEFLITTTTLN